jgi:hypothetical protein
MEQVWVNINASMGAASGVRELMTSITCGEGDLRISNNVGLPLSLHVQSGVTNVYIYIYVCDNTVTLAFV